MIKKNLVIILLFSFLALAFFYINSSITVEAAAPVCSRCEKKIYDLTTGDPLYDKDVEILDLGYFLDDCQPNHCSTSGTISQRIECPQYSVDIDNCDKAPKAYWNSDNTEACTTFRGWACDPDIYNDPLRIDFYYKNNVSDPFTSSNQLPSATADVSREDDVRIACGGGTSAHGFSIATPANLKDGGNHYIYAFAIGINNRAGYAVVNTQLDTNNPTYRTINCAPPPPDIQGMTVKNSSTSQTTFSGTYQISGNQSSQKGKNWLNPITITLNATPGNTATSTEYYVSFYDKSMGAVSNGSNFVTEVTGKLQTDGSKGFLLYYKSDGTSKVYDPYSQTWIDLKDFSSGYKVCGYTGRNKDCDYKTYYTAFKIGDKSWKILFDKKFKGYSMYTSGYVKDNTNLDKFTQDITPTQ